MALDPNQLLAKLFGWVWRTKEPLFGAADVATLVNCSKDEADKALKALARDGKLEQHGSEFSLPGAAVAGGRKSAPAAAADAPAAARDDDDEMDEPEPIRPAKSAPVAPPAPEVTLTMPADAPVHTWLIDVCDAAVDFVQQYKRDGLTVADLDNFAGRDFEDTYPDDDDVAGRIYQILEFLADREILTRGSVDGSYTCHPLLIEREQSVANKLDRMDIRRATKREYTIECAVPYTGLKGLAYLLYDGQCFLHPELTFPTPEGADYVEVHHIHRVAQGGNESLENLVLLNPYDHKMCHFATDDVIGDMEAKLKGMLQSRMEALLAPLGGGKSKKAPSASTKSAAAKTGTKSAASAKKAPVAKKAAAAKSAAKKPAAKKTAPAKKPAAKKTASKR